MANECIAGKQPPKAHHCSWPGCKMRVPATVWGCRSHWFRLPAPLRAKIWAAYVPGQSVASWSEAYRAAHAEVDRWILEQAGLPKPLGDRWGGGA